MSPKNAVTHTPFKLQLDSVVRNLKTDYEVWKSCHSSGWPLVANISRVCGKCLTSIRNQSKRKTKRALRQGRSALHRLRSLLKEPSERLAFLVDRLLDARENTRRCLKMLRWMCACSEEMSRKIYYCNWQLKDFLEFAETVMLLYDAEYEIKEMVMEEITKSKNHDELLHMRQAWRVPVHALTEKFAELFKEFDFETREIKIGG